MCQNGGFTLIELLVVVLIIGILSAVAVPQYEAAVQKSRFVAAMTAGDALYRASETYRMANGEWPSLLDDLDIAMPGTETYGNTLSTKAYLCSLANKQENLSEMSPSVQCWSRGGNMNWGFRRFFSDSSQTGGKRFCFALITDEKPNKLCQTMGGEYMFKNDAHNYYQLP